MVNGTTFPSVDRPSPEAPPSTCSLGQSIARTGRTLRIAAQMLSLRALASILALSFAHYNHAACLVNAQFSAGDGTDIRAAKQYLDVARRDGVESAADCAYFRVVNELDFPRALQQQPVDTATLMQSIADLQRQAAAKGTPGDYLSRELELRRKFISILLSYIAEQQAPPLAKSELGRQIVLQNTYAADLLWDQKKKAEIHNLLIRTPVQYLQTKPAEQWFKAVLSCPKWNGVVVKPLGCESECDQFLQSATRAANMWKQVNANFFTDNISIQELVEWLNAREAACKSS